MVKVVDKHLDRIHEVREAIQPGSTHGVGTNTVPRGLASVGDTMVSLKVQDPDSVVLASSSTRPNVARANVPGGFASVGNSIMSCGHNIEGLAIHGMVITYSTSSLAVRQNEERVEELRKETESIDRDLKKASEVRREQERRSNRLKMGSRILGYVTSALAFGGGAVLCTVNPLAGVVVMGSGAVSIFNRIMADTGGYREAASLFTSDSDKQELASLIMDTGMTAGTAVVSLASGGYVTVIESSKLANLALTTASSLTSLADGSVRFADGVVNKSVSTAEAESMVLRTEREITDKNTELAYSLINQTSSSAAEQCRSLSELLVAGNEN